MKGEEGEGPSRTQAAQAREQSRPTPVPRACLVSQCPEGSSVLAACNSLVALQGLGTSASAHRAP